MIAYSETKDWRKTFERCIPIRKVKVEDETGCGFDYRQVKSQKQMEEISEFRINRFEMKHTLHICCEKQKIPYEFKTRELTYDEYLEENKGRKHLETSGNTWKSDIPEKERRPFLRFEATAIVNGQEVGKGRGKSQRAAQGRASWFGLVHLGEITLEEEK